MPDLASVAILGVPLWALVGFMLAAYAIVANDVIQTLGTFLASNAKRPWLVLWAFASTIIVVVMVFGYITYNGDIAYGRLNRIPFPETGIQWWHVLPPLALLVLTRFGIPVSTTFLVLTIFTLTGGAATAGVLGDMMLKSLTGYGVAFATGGIIFVVIAHAFEKWVARTQVDDDGDPWWTVPGVALLICVLIYLLVYGPTVASPDDVSLIGAGVVVALAVGTAYATRRFNTWFVLQWLSTGFLWSQWLKQDLANIFIYLPRETTLLPDGSVQVTFSIGLLIFSTLLMVGLHAIIFAARGGEIQKIVLRKTNTVDVRSATVVDFLYGLILMYFKELNDIPMSTTYVFLGLLAGREIAITFMTRLQPRAAALKDVFADIGRAGIGLAVSVTLALMLPFMATGEWPDMIQALFG